jgi:hypothetical protein
MGRRVRRDVQLHARTRSVNAWHRSGQRITTRRRDRVRVWPSDTASRPMQSSHIAWPHSSVVVVGSRHMGQVGMPVSGTARLTAHLGLRRTHVGSGSTMGGSHSASSSRLTARRGRQARGGDGASAAGSPDALVDFNTDHDRDARRDGRRFLVQT